MCKEQKVLHQTVGHMLCLSFIQVAVLVWYALQTISPSFCAVGQPIWSGPRSALTIGCLHKDNLYGRVTRRNPLLRTAMLGGGDLVELESKMDGDKYMQIVVENLFSIMSGGHNNVGWGVNTVIVDGETGNILNSNFFKVNSAGLLDFLKTIQEGNIVLVASYNDPAEQLTDEVRELFAGMGSRMVYSVKHRDNWMFAGARGLNKENPFEKLIVNDKKTNAYGDWPEMGELGGCFPRKV
ncbi:protein FAM3C isoform X2 [Ictalurus punctatus]|uniref:Protein FAM3C isoform X2 n=1 Tax=Ictalurus punctatus TaxID=7998 RepID=A0A9F7TJM5_ICTPU|nr:protein FAM3C isoform X2 [Ictalurus punctatus]XP_053539654.1 protein FAM3C isoform X2 [Ictalurus punctatus]